MNRKKKNKSGGEKFVWTKFRIVLAIFSILGILACAYLFGEYIQRKGDNKIKSTPTPVLKITPTPESTPTPVLRITPIPESTTKAETKDKVINNDPNIYCKVATECGGGTKLLKQSVCNNSICCQIGDKWIFYTDKNKCLEDQKNLVSTELSTLPNLENTEKETWLFESEPKDSQGVYCSNPNSRCKYECSVADFWVDDYYRILNNHLAEYQLHLEIYGPDSENTKIWADAVMKTYNTLYDYCINSPIFHPQKPL
jgi:hypothetical protein